MLSPASTRSFSRTRRRRDLARGRLLKAAKRFGIVPVGFITGQLQSERELGRRGEPVHLPTGFVTMLFTDVEGSTGLLHRLGDGYGELLDGVRVILERTATEHAGHIVETRADEVFAVFEQSGRSRRVGSRRCSARWQRRPGPVRSTFACASGSTAGHPQRAAPNYVGMAVNTASRICGVAHGGQILVSADTRTAMRGSTPTGFRLRGLGPVPLRGVPEEVALYQVVAKGLLRQLPAAPHALIATSPLAPGRRGHAASGRPSHFRRALRRRRRSARCPATPDANAMARRAGCSRRDGRGSASRESPPADRRSTRSHRVPARSRVASSGSPAERSRAGTAGRRIADSASHPGWSPHGRPPSGTRRRAAAS